MKRITKITLFALGLATLSSLAILGLPAVVKAANGNIFNFDVACDCRTGDDTFTTGGNRGDAFLVNGKIFPAGTLPTGTASNDPTQPVNGVASIGDWICRGQVAGVFPPTVAPAYALTPPYLYTQYYILKNGTFFTEGYSVGEGGQSAVTGGFGGYSGASGDLVAQVIGTNISGCPNIRFKVSFQPGSMR